MRNPAFFLNILGLVLLPLFGNATIYGENSLHEAMSHADPLVREVSQSIAVEVLNTSIREVGPDDRIRIATTTPRRRSICEKEPFLDQPLAGVCTGSLIAPDLLLTAGHCLGGFLSCSSAKWIFDFQISGQEGDFVSVPSSSVYSCTKILASNYANRLDYAIVQLDRPVNDRKPLTVSAKMTIEKGMEVMSIGSPYGMTLKTSTGLVRDSSNQNFFTTNLDVMRGSSGGPIFDARTMQIIGIVARGEVDLVSGPDLSLVCNVFKRCENNECKGEDSTRVSEIPYFKNSNR